jgi:two-component system sensor histidine kinase ChvG
VSQNATVNEPRADGSEPKAPWFHQLFRIRTRLLAASVLLVILPVAGLSFARTFERELLRSEEEGMIAVAVTLASGAAQGGLQDPRVQAQAQAVARQLSAQIRLLDQDGKASSDTGPEAVEKVTEGRRLLPSSMRKGGPVVVGDPPPPSGSFRERAEVRKALGGQAGRTTRVSERLRSVRLFVAEPIRRPDGSQVGVVYLSRTTYPVLVSMYRIRNGLVRVVAASLLVALIVALYQALTISRPLARLTDAARRIAGGERGVALKLSGRDEAAELARAFDAMARELDTRLNYISELAANVSHEFKTPIASIRAAAEVLRDGAAEDPVARDRFLNNIEEDTERLSRLVSRLLELSRIEAHLHERREPFDYRALVEDLVDSHAAPPRRVTLDYRAPSRLLCGDEERLASALRNLVDNALQAGAARVQVTVQEQGDELLTEVTDEGSGISPANLARVWDRFFTTRREGGGTGLGLAIVKAVIEAHGGEVGARSEPGAGSTFWFRLPRRL